MTAHRGVAETSGGGGASTRFLARAGAPTLGGGQTALGSREGGDDASEGSWIAQKRRGVRGGRQRLLIQMEGGEGHGRRVGVGGLRYEGEGRGLAHGPRPQSGARS
jgi:hypothetical protein